jgi:hypothetical protein
MNDFVSKGFLHAELAYLRAELIKWNVGILLAMTGLFAGIVKLL